jgi:hypothetical protein
MEDARSRGFDNHKVKEDLDELKKKQAEIDALKNPVTPKPIIKSDRTEYDGSTIRPMKKR